MLRINGAEKAKNTTQQVLNLMPTDKLSYVVSSFLKNTKIQFFEKTTGDNSMKDNQASFTAMMIAYMRAYHAIHNNPKIFDDFLAYDLIPEEKRALIEQHLNCDNLMQITNSPLSRARYTEDTLEKAIRQGVKQYVILGAGMDTFAFRRPDLMERLEVLEIDHPATQEFKLHRLTELEWEHPAKLHFIPIDFTKENLVTAITRSSSYDPKVKSLFSWLGVTPYLTRDEVFTTLRSIVEVASVNSIVVFDYLDTDIFIPEKVSPQLQKFMELVQKIGEPIITGFNPQKLSEDLTNMGFQLHENMSQADVEGRYLQERTDGYYMQEQAYLACAVIQ